MGINLVEKVVQELTGGWETPDFGRSLKDIQLMGELKELRPVLTELIEEELVNLQENAERERIENHLKSIMIYMGKVLYENLDRRIKGLDLKTPARYGVVSQYAKVRGDSVEITAEVEIYTGARANSGNVVSDHKMIERQVLGEMRTLSMDGFNPEDNIRIRLKDKPEIIPASGPISTKLGIIYPTHQMKAAYSIRITLNQVELLYCAIQPIKS